MSWHATGRNSMFSSFISFEDSYHLICVILHDATRQWFVLLIFNSYPYLLTPYPILSRNLKIILPPPFCTHSHELSRMGVLIGFLLFQSPIHAAFLFYLVTNFVPSHFCSNNSIKNLVLSSFGNILTSFFDPKTH